MNFYINDIRVTCYGSLNIKILMVIEQISGKECKMNQEKIPQPSIKLPIVGHLLYLQHNIQKSFVNLSSKLGPIYRLKLGPTNVVVVSGLEIIREVCDESRFTKDLGLVASSLKDTVGATFGLLLSDDPMWAKLYRIILPKLQQKALQEDYFPIMKNVLEQLFKKWESLFEKKEVRLDDELSRVVIDIVGLCEFDYHFNAIVSEKPNPLFKVVEELFQYIAIGTFLNKFLNRLRFQGHKKFQHNLSILKNYTADILENRKKHILNPNKDLLYSLLQEVDKVTGEKFNDTILRDQICGILLGSVGSSSSLLILAFYTLLTHPIVLEKAYAEVDHVLGTDLNSPLSAKSFTKLVYISQILNECLRLWPPSFIERKPIEDTLLDGKYLLKKGEHIWLTIAMIHKDKAIWGKDADSFNPDRFAPELVARRDPYAFLPFGSGKRSCTGRQFALYLTTIALSMILQRYKLHLLPLQKFDEMSITSETPPTLWVTLEKRRHEKPIQEYHPNKDR